MAPVGVSLNPVGELGFHGLQVRQQPAGIEEAVRIEAAFQAPMDFHDRARQRMKLALRARAAPTHGGTTRGKREPANIELARIS